MTTCEVCGHPYDQSPELWLVGDEIEVFDTFECAFYSVSPTCAGCGRQIVEHGLEAGGIFFCCAHCAREYKAAGLQKLIFRYKTEISLALGQGFC